MKMLFRLLRWALGILLVTPLTVIAILILYNLRDETLDPQLEQLLAAAPAQIPTETNGYFTWIGVVGPESEAPHSWGLRWYRQALAADAAGLKQNGRLSIEEEKRKDDLRNEEIPCTAIETCLEAVAARPEAARALLAKGRPALARGDAAVALPAYQEAWRPEMSVASPLPSYANFHRPLSATRFALLVSEQRDDEALRLLDREMAFHVRQLQGAVTLIEKMLAMASLRGDYLLMNQYLVRRPDAARQRSERIASMLQMPPPEALSMQTVISNEIRTMARLFLTMKKQDEISSAFGVDGDATFIQNAASKIGLSLYLPKASANEYLRLHRQLLMIDGLSGDDYRHALREAKRVQENAEENSYALYNPVGHILVAVATPSYGAYFLRRDDLLALRAMLALQLSLLRDKSVENAAVERTLNSVALIHPYTGAPPAWNPATRTLAYAALPERRGNKPLTMPF